MDFDLILFIIFCIGLFIFFKTHRSKFEVQGKIIALYKTKLGLKFMEKFTKLPKWIVHILSTSSILIGFSGMILIFYELIKGTFKLVTVPNAQPVLAPVLPGVSVPGLPKLSFLHWIISIFIVAVIHEFSHGIFARMHNTKVQSSGFLIMGPILGAFVEPDEEELKKKSAYKQLSIFAAGPFSNIITGIVFWLIALLIINPLAYGAIEYNGVQIAGLDENYPAMQAGLKIGYEITAIDNQEIKSVEDFIKIMNSKKPNDQILIKTKDKEFNLKLVENPNNKELGYLGIKVTGISAAIKEDVAAKYGTKLPWVLFWLSKLFFWLWLISIGIALFNLLPLGPVDGGRMLLTGLGIFIKKEKNTKKIWGFVSFFLLALIVINLLPFLKKLLLFLIKPIVALI